MRISDWSSDVCSSDLRAVTDIRDKITQIRSNLPNGILEPQVIRLSTSGNTLAYWSASATDMTLEELSWYVDNVVAKRLIAVPGMGHAYLPGGVSRELRVILNPERMPPYRLSDLPVHTQLTQPKQTRRTPSKEKRN